LYYSQPKVKLGWGRVGDCFTGADVAANVLAENRGEAIIFMTPRHDFPEYPALSDRVFTFFNESAKRACAEMPDRSLVAYAYSVYRTPPARLKALEPNLIVGYVGLDLEAIDAWSKIAPKLYIRPNDLGPAIDLGMPRNHAAYLAEAVKFCVEHHAIGFDFDNCQGNWRGHGLDYYVLGKALWNPDLNARAIIAIYAERLAAVETMLKSKALTPELASLHSHRYLRMALSYAEREVE